MATPEVRATVASAPTGWSERGAIYAVSAPHSDGPSLAKLLALARPMPTDRCLDIGTGTGHTAARLAAAGAAVVGIDPAAGMLDAARELYGQVPNLSFVEARGDATGFEDDAFDLVTARHTLHHHHDVAATLKEVARVLRPGGRFVFVDEATPDDASDAWLDELERARDATHVRAYSLAEWHRMLAAANLEWVVGDIETEYLLDVRSWVARMSLSSADEAAVARLFLAANTHERQRFAIEYEGEEAMRFRLPMALILALKAPASTGVEATASPAPGTGPTAELENHAARLASTQGDPL